MDWQSLELKLVSCRDLKAFNFFQKLSAYSVVSIVIINEQPKKKEEHPQKKHLQRQKTAIAKGGKNPEWNHVFEFDLESLPPEESDHLFLKFDLRPDGLVNRTIGEVRVPLKALIDDFCGVVRFVSYQVRDSDGKPNGVLNFSYKLKGKVKTNGNYDDSPRLIPSSSPEKGTQCSSDKIVYPKVEVDDNNNQSWRREIVRYPSLDDACNTGPVFQWQTAGTGSYYSSRNIVTLVPGGYLDPYSRSSPVVQPSVTYWYTMEPTMLQ
ncbi:hypothetical protein ES319_A05G394800v1 [Gossypium barbadense]|uniref:C2 domain-containing protein n=1 Tax=Gossypium barbadense TaxID=3634 RepID=A0A2P5WAY5_GOSBA|nr:hypothetical protein ES319_A05G394800v1 [Gossypium barbadense]PPR88254.1 hypothetical protein GOBAR_AA32440 [Gossypium barbadense]